MAKFVKKHTKIKIIALYSYDSNGTIWNASESEVNNFTKDKEVSSIQFERAEHSPGVICFVVYKEPIEK